MAGQPQAPNRDVLDSIAEDFKHEQGVTIGTMFRSPGLRIGSKIFVFLGHHGQFIVKLPRDRADEFVDAGTAEPVVMGKRTMREWVAIPPQTDRTATLMLWRNVAREAYEYVNSLRQSN